MVDVVILRKTVPWTLIIERRLFDQEKPLPRSVSFGVKLAGIPPTI